VLPSWCALPHPLVTRDDVVARSIALLAHGPVTLVGAPGVGTTTAAAELATTLVTSRHCEVIVAVRVHRCTVAGDVLTLIGRQIGAAVPGVASSVQAALAARRVVCLLDDADLAPRSVEGLPEFSPTTRWIATGRAPVLGARVEVGPLTDREMTTLLGPGESPAPYRGIPVLTRFPVPPTLEDPWVALTGVPTGAEATLAFPFGRRRRPAGLPAGFLRSHLGRAIPRRCVSEMLGATEPGVPALRAAIRAEEAEVEQVAVGLTPASMDDLALYRTAAQRVRDPMVASLAAAAAARATLNQFRVFEALEICEACRVAHESTRIDGAIGPTWSLMSWVEGDVRLALGQEAHAEALFQQAEAGLRIAEHDDLAHMLARSCASAWAVRGRGERARQWLTRARETLPIGDDRAASADLMRIAADLSAQAGELVGADALYAEARALAARRPVAQPVPALLACGQAALDMARGQFASANSHLWPDEIEEPDPPAVIGPLSFRRAELALRRRRIDDARVNAQLAHAAWWRDGDLAGLILAERLLGDIAAIAGDRAEACERYRAAIALCVGPRALEPLARVLERLLAVEREGAPGPHVDELRDQLELVHLLLQLDRA
jgi:hypothetical protein